MLDRYLRPLKDRVLAPVARALGPGVHPNAISWVACGVGISSAIAVIAGRPGVALGLWLANRVLDGLDGTHARVHGRESDFGAYLDIVLDFIVYAAIPAALIVAGREYDLAVAGVLLLGSFYVNAASWMYLAAVLERRREGATSRGEATATMMPPGVVAGTETMVFYALFFLLPSHQATLFRLMAALVLVNVAMRVSWAARQLH